MYDRASMDGGALLTGSAGAALAEKGGAEVIKDVPCIALTGLTTESRTVITPSGNEKLVCVLHLEGGGSAGGRGATVIDFPAVHSPGGPRATA